MRADVRISMQGNECECIYASGVYIKVNRQGVWQKSKADDYVLVIPIDDEAKKNDNTHSDNQSDTE